MSVAFRRESDEEHLEPRFELPIPPGPNLVTPRGLQLLEAKVAELDAAIAATIATGADEDARKTLQREQRYFLTRLATAEIAPTPEPCEAGIGSTVTFRLNGRTRTITISGHDEADPAADRLSFAAPLARALMGAVEGDLLDHGGVAEAITVLAVAP